jgi:hypothetical protein
MGLSPVIPQLSHNGVPPPITTGTLQEDLSIEICGLETLPPPQSDAPSPLLPEAPPPVQPAAPLLPFQSNERNSSFSTLGELGQAIEDSLGEAELRRMFKSKSSKL